MSAIQKPELQQLATEINAEHSAVEDTLRAGLAHALHCGELLMTAKKLAAHGEWLPWLRANCTVSERTAQAYIRLTSRRAELEEKSATRYGFEDLSFRQGLKLLAEPTKADESWQDRLKPESTCIPPEGYMLQGTRGKTTVYIAHSEKHPGYCFVVRLVYDGTPRGMGNSAVDSCELPCRNEWIEDALGRMRVNIGSFTWEEVPAAPWSHNPYWLPDVTKSSASIPRAVDGPDGHPESTSAATGL